MASEPVCPCLFSMVAMTPPSVSSRSSAARWEMRGSCFRFSANAISDPLRQFGRLANVAGRRQRQQTLFFRFRNRQTANEGMQCFTLDALAARELLQLL